MTGLLFWPHLTQQGSSFLLELTRSPVGFGPNSARGNWDMGISGFVVSGSNADVMIGTVNVSRLSMYSLLQFLGTGTR